MDVADLGRRSTVAALGASENAKTSSLLKVNPALEPSKLAVDVLHSDRRK